MPKKNDVLVNEIIRYFKSRGVIVAKTKIVVDKKTKKTSLLKGFPSLVAFFSYFNTHVYFEVIGKGKKQSQDQKEFERICRQYDQHYFVLRSVKDAINIADLILGKNR